MGVSLLAKMKAHTAERRRRSSHPILSLPVNRDVRDAYFETLVFASVADNGKMDDAERVQLEKVGLALGMTSAEVDEITNDFTSADDKGKISHAASAADALKGSGVADLLLCEFSQVWTSRDHDMSELEDFRKHLAEWMDVRYDDKFFAVFDDVSVHVKANPSAAYVLCDYLDDGVIRYLFADVFEIEKVFAEQREAEERAITPHPLKLVLNNAQKAHYLKAIRSAVEETSDNSPSKIQQKGLRHLAIAMRVKDVGECERESEQVLSLYSGMRTVGFFLYCDISRLFAMAGHAKFSAAQCQILDDVAAALKLPLEDAVFLGAYRVFIGTGKEADAAKVVQHAQSSIRFPNGFIRYFTPNMNPIVLAGGDTPAGVYQIVDGHYRLEKTLKVGFDTRLVIKNASIDFAPEAQIELNGSAEDISDSEFNGEETEGDDLIGKQFFRANQVKGVKFERCCFNGAGCRSVICAQGNIVIESCRFNRLCGRKNRSIICSDLGSVKISDSQWNDCRAKECFCYSYYYGSNIELIACDFISCFAQAFLCTGFDKDIVCRMCLFERCEFKDFHKFDMVTSGGRIISDNYFDASTGNSAGISSMYLPANITIERLREVRAELRKK